MKNKLPFNGTAYSLDLTAMLINTVSKNHSRLNNCKKIFLLHRKCFLTFLFFAMSFCVLQSADCQEVYRIAFWNVENLFDTQNDTVKNDDDFTPQGSYRWSHRRYWTKLRHVYQTIVAMGMESEPPAIIGLAEVENDKVLNDLCRGTQLRRLGYKYIHYESPDLRGIDNALLYRSDRFRPLSSKAISVSDSSKGYFTRDILFVEGVTNSDDTIILLVNHFPSKRNSNADRLRMAQAEILRHIMDTLQAAHKTAAVIAIGDFNASPDEPEIAIGLMKDSRFVNLMSCIEPGRGSYKYQDLWTCLDQIIVSRNVTEPDGICPLQTATQCGQIFDKDFLLLKDDKYMGYKVFRTYLGIRYLGGYSDHLPVYIDLRNRYKNEQQ